MRGAGGQGRILRKLAEGLTRAMQQTRKSLRNTREIFNDGLWMSRWDEGNNTVLPRPRQSHKPVT